MNESNDKYIEIDSEIERAADVAKGLRFIIPQAIFLFSIFWFLDQKYVPEMSSITLSVRLCTILALLVIHQLAGNPQKLHGASVLGLLYTTVVSASLTLLIFQTGGTESLYQPSLNLASVGTIVLLSVKRKYLIAGITLIYFPYYILTLFFSPQDLLSIKSIIELFFAFGTIWAGLTIRRFGENLRTKELESRNLLGLEIQKREEKIQDQTEFQTQFIRDAAIGSVTNQVLHDLKAPLTALNLLKKSSSLVEKENSLLHTAFDRLEELLAQMGHSARAPESRKSYNALNVSLNLILVESRYICSSTNINFEWKWPSTQLEVFTDHKALARIVANLVQNSIRATSHQIRPKIRVGFGLNPVGELLVITVADNGSGFPMQLGVNSSGGLGLNYINSYLEQENGNITLLEPTSEFKTIIQVSIPIQIKNSRAVGS